MIIKSKAIYTKQYIQRNIYKAMYTKAIYTKQYIHISQVSYRSIEKFEDLNDSYIW